MKIRDGFIKRIAMAALYAIKEHNQMYPAKAISVEEIHQEMVKQVNTERYAPHIRK